MVKDQLKSFLKSKYLIYQNYPYLNKYHSLNLKWVCKKRHPSWYAMLILLQHIIQFTSSIRYYVFQ